MQSSRLDTGGIVLEQQLQTLNASQRAAVWAERIAACRSSELSVRAWCRENQVSEKTYYYWQHRLFRMVTEQQATFAEVTRASGISRKPDLTATVRIGRAEADVYSGADTETIETVLRFLSHAE